MVFETFIAEINKLLPFDAGIEHDKLGIQIKSSKREITKLLVTYEVTNETLNEIILVQPDCVISFHPLIYSPLTFINTEERVGKLIREFALLDVSLIICHTNFDAYKFGTSWLFANKIGLSVEGFLDPNPRYPDFGMGVLGSFPESISIDEFLGKIFEVTNSPIRWCSGRNEQISKVAIVGGSGISYADIAYTKESDAFITSDVSYHNFHKFNGKMMLVDPGHWEMEYHVVQGLGQMLNHHFKEFGIVVYISTAYSNPINYYPNNEFNQKQKEMLSYILEKL